MKGQHYWRRRLNAADLTRLVAAVCDPQGTLSQLSTEPRPALTWFERLVSIVTTPFKRLGISGWVETSCAARGLGVAVRDAQHSTDGFWTIDVALSDFAIGSLSADLSPPRFLRLEIEPETAAHEICGATRVRKDMRLSFGGAVVIDTDEDFLEIHPDREFRIGA